MYLRFNPYKKSTIKSKVSEILKPRFYGPYKLIRKDGEVANELELPKGRKIHNVFHVSCPALLFTWLIFIPLAGLD